MRKSLMVLVILLGVLCMLNVPGAAEDEKNEQESEWTVMFYLCGSDLESNHSYASSLLSDILQCHYPASLVPKETYHRLNPNDRTDLGNVNVLVQTGGSKRWHTHEKRQGVNLYSNRLYRLSYYISSGEESRFVLNGTLPLQSMADPETLTSFIRWGMNTCPAKKYALVLWGHGGGAKTGILHDELFNGDILYLDELGTALANSGAHFETIVLDACLMANIEAAHAVYPYADWMVASEELVPGQGTAVDDWLQELYNQPEMKGKRLGRNICDMTMVQYANMENDQAKDLITWSVIDLQKIPRVYEACRQISGSLYFAYQASPSFMRVFAEYINSTEEYGQYREEMRDLASLFYQPGTENLMDLYWRNEMLDALDEAVVYCVRGPGRSGARGLSFCYPVDSTEDELDSYARNCTLPHYLAFLDAISSWTAPDAVFEVAPRLPELSTLDGYRMTAEKRMSQDGVPGLAFQEDDYRYLNVNYRLYRQDPESGQLMRLGRTPCRSFRTDDGLILWSAVEPWWWPSIDGNLCDIEMVSGTSTSYLYSVPIQVDTEVWYLRYGREFETSLIAEEQSLTERYPSRYTVYGLWEGYDNDSTLPTRNIKSLSQMVGREYRLLYPLEQKRSVDPAEYYASERNTLYRAMTIEPKLLPPGTYYLEYEVQDMFMRQILMERIEMEWDGEKLSFPAGFVWEGETELTVSN